MNKSYRSIWNAAKQVYVAAAETVSARGKPCSGTKIAARIAVLTGGLLALTANAQTAPPPNALPTGGQVSAGQATISQNGANMVVTQGSDRAAIDWQSFNVGQNAHVQFQQPGASSVALNRVVGPDPSQIFGRITANGQVILTNPAGVYFGPSARVDVGGLIATTHSISNDDFMAGKYKFERNGSEGKVVNEGELKAAIEGYVALLAPEVRNQGAIIAQMGTVALAAGEAFDLHFDSNNRLTSIRVEPSQIETLVENRYAVKAPGGLVILSAQSMDRLIGGVVKNSGTIEANGLKEQGGRIILAASNTVENTGIVRADAADGLTLADSGPAGSIDIAAPKVVNSGTISANGSKTATAPANRKGGNVKITATEAVVNSGTIEATSAAPVAAVQDAGRIQVQAPRIEQTASGRLDVSGEQQGGTLALQASGAVTLAGKLDASAKLEGDTQGGLIDVTTPGPITLIAAQLDTSGGQGGQIQLKAFATETVIEPAQPATPLPLPEDSNSGHLAILGNSSINSRGRSRNGGRVALLGDHIALNDTTRIDVTGATGGGEVLVGGDWQGGNGVYQATTVVMDEGVVIDASAIDNGDGGKVVLWSDVHNPDSVTTARGSVFARGGEYGGNGGKVETSASTINIDTFKVSTAALLGKTGLWLIDPSDYTINDAAARNIETALNENNVTVTTAVSNASYGANNNSTDTGNITIAAALTSSSAKTLELKAANNIYINADITRSSGGLTLRAANNSISGTGKLILGGGTTLSLHKGNVLSNAIELTGDVTVNFASFELDYLVVGGGGGGGGDAGAGGGGGGMVYGTLDPLALGVTSFSVTVGGGGDGGIHAVMNNDDKKDGTNGGDSIFSASGVFSVTAGGGQGGLTGPANQAGGAGGTNTVSRTSAQGNKPGGAGGKAEYYTGGSPVTSSGVSGEDGPKTEIVFCTVAGCSDETFGTISDANAMRVYGGGGGGGPLQASSSSPGSGGRGGAGNSGYYRSHNLDLLDGEAGDPNSGGGGGAGAGGSGTRFGKGGAGGSGVVKLRYFGKSDIATGGTEANGVLEVAGYRVHTFTDPAPAEPYTFIIEQAQLAITLNGNISGSGNLTLNATNGTMSLGGTTSTYTGTTQITGGTVKTTSSSALGNSIVTLANAANTTLDISGSNLTIGGLSGGGATGGNVVLGDKTLTTGNTTDTTFNGFISGTGGLTKQGAGTFTLTANQTYTGATAINAGTLVLQNNAPTTDSSGFSGAGTLRIEPTGTSFTSAFSTSGWSFGANLGGLTLGKAGNVSNITVPNALSIAGPIHIYGGDLSLDGGITTSSDLTTVATGFTSFGATSVSGALSSTTRGAGTSGGVKQTGAITVTGISTFIADTGTNQEALLDNSANNFGGAVSFTSANNGTWRSVSIKDTNALTLGNVTTSGDLTTNAGGLTSFGATSVGGMLSSTTRGAGALGGVKQTGAISVAGTSTFIADTGTDQEAVLTNAANNFGGAVSFTNANSGNWKSVSIKDTDALTLGNVTTTGDLTTDVGGSTSFGATSVGGMLSSTTRGAGALGGVKQTGAIKVAGTSTFIAHTGADQVAQLEAANDFVGAVSFTDANSGSWKSVSIKDTNGITLGDITTRKDLTVDGGTGDIKQDPTGDKKIVVDGDTTLRTDGEITLDGAANDFKGLVNGDGKNITLKDTNGLTLGDITTRKDPIKGDGGALTVDGGTGDITQDTTGDKNIVVEGDTTLRADGEIKLDGATNDFKGNVNGDGKNITLNDTNGLTLGDITTRKDQNGNGGTLTVHGGTGDIKQDTTGDKNIVVDGDTTLRADGEIKLDGATNDFKGLVNGDGKNITLKDANGLTLGDITTRKDQNGNGGALTVDGGTGDITQDTTGDKNIVVDGDTTLRADGEIKLDGPTNDFKGNVNGDGKNITLKDTNGLTLGDITTRKDQNGDGGVLTVDGGTGDIKQDTTGGKNIVVDGDTTLRADGEIKLDGATNDFKGNVNGDGKNITLKDTNGLTLGDITTRKDQNGNGGTLTVDGGTGDIKQDTTGDKNIVVDGDTTLRTDGEIKLDGATNDFKGSVNGDGKNITLKDTNGLTLGDITTRKDQNGNGGALTVDGGTGDIKQDTTGDKNIVVDGDTTLRTDGEIKLDGATNDFKGSVNGDGKNITLKDTNGLTLGDITTRKDQNGDGGALTVDGGTGDIKQDTTGDKNIVVDGDTTLRADGDITLDGTTNDFKGIVNVIGADDVKLNDTNDLVLGNVDITGKLDATADTDLTLDGTIRSRSLDLEATKGDILQRDNSTITVTNGPTDLKAGDDVTLNSPKNDFNGNVNAKGDDISLTDSNSLTLGDVNTTGNLTLNTTGLLDLGTSRINGKLNAITNNGNIIQAGPLYVGGDTDLNAGTGRVTLTNTGNDLRGRINVIASFYEIAGGAGNNAGKLQERVLGTLPVTPSPGLPGSRFGTSTPPEPLTLNGATSSTGTMAFTDGANGTGIVVKQEPTPATDGATIVTVSVPTESAKPGSTFKFELPESVRDLTQGGAEPQVALINGGPIPSWLTFDVETMTFVAAEVPAGGIPIDVAVVIGDQRVIVAVSENAEA